MTLKLGDSLGKKKVIEKLFLTFLKCSLPILFRKYNLRDRSPCLFRRYVYVYTGASHARHFIGSRYILLQLEARFFKLTLEKF